MEINSIIENFLFFSFYDRLVKIVIRTYPFIGRHLEPPFEGGFWGNGERKEEFLLQSLNAEVHLRTKHFTTLVRKSLLAETCENNIRADTNEINEGWLNTSETPKLAGKSFLADLDSAQVYKWLIQKGYLPKQVFPPKKSGWFGNILEFLFTMMLHAYSYKNAIV